MTKAYSELTQATTPAVRQRQLAAVKHGLFVRAPSGLRLRSRKVRRLAQKVRSVLPWLAKSDEPVLRTWCEFEITTAPMFVAIDAGVATEGQIDQWRRLKIVQLAVARELGMTPSARAELGLTVSQGMTFTERLATAIDAKNRREGQQ